MNKPKIVRPEVSQPAHALWFDRKKYVTINFAVQKPTGVQVDIQPDKMILWWVCVIYSADNCTRFSSD
ncbi:hypothetical protein CCH79_00016752 [Gambusia affinis]|uniref:Uncharacterized protein n=1 Tax=Gambusia affinis TaxID=33528 RepID=A0A315UPV8_GAMAF|nr:hypothetical protein CCH79_00016752 [Gambusia affinis]